MNENENQRRRAGEELGREAEESVHEESMDERERLEAQLRRAMADLANLRKRQAKELVDARVRAIEALTAEILPVLDNFHLALGATDSQLAEAGEFDPNAIVEGLQMVRAMLEGVLERHGLSEIPAEAAVFDPNVHEAVGVDSETAVAPGTITKVVQRGYRVGDRVLRPSRVIVAGEPQDGGENSQGAGGAEDEDQDEYQDRE